MLLIVDLPQVPVHVAQREDLRDGRGAGRRGARHHHPGTAQTGGQRGEFMFEISSMFIGRYVYLDFICED